MPGCARQGTCQGRPQFEPVNALVGLRRALLDQLEVNLKVRVLAKNANKPDIPMIAQAAFSHFQLQPSRCDQSTTGQKRKSGRTRAVTTLQG